ncbi:MAG: hypothetical protein WDZ93_04045 [Candidatus Paceibacterota bacterium]
MERFATQLARTTISVLIGIMLFASSAPAAQAFDLRSLISGVTGGQNVTIRADISTVGITNTLKNTLSEISNALQTKLLTSLNIKETILDGLAWNITQNALNQITADMINWANGGFNGEPAFVTDLEGFLVDVLDESAGEFLFGQELQRLCEPLRIQVPSTLAIQYKNVGRPNTSAETQCVFDDMPDTDIAAFMEGEFNQGSWNAFFELTIGNANDPIGAYLDGKVKLYTGNVEDKRNAEREYDAGDGVMPQKDCEYIQLASGYSKKKCTTLTPGFIVRDAMSFNIGQLPALRLLQADELNEVIGGFANSLTNQALQGTFGLLGLGGNARYNNAQFGENGNQSYIDVLRTDQGGAGNTSTAELTAALATNVKYREIQQEIIDTIDDLEDQLADGEARYPSCFNLELTEDLELDKSDAETNLAVVEQVTSILEQMKELAESGTINQQSVVYQQYVRLQAEGLIQTEYDVTRLRSEFMNFEFQARVDEFQDAIDAEEASCS